MSKEAMKMALDALEAVRHTKFASHELVMCDAPEISAERERLKMRLYESMHNEQLFRLGAEDVLRDALAQQPAPVPQQSVLLNVWQPAETAPKNARILFIPKKDEHGQQEHINICWWSAEKNGWRSDLCEDFGGNEDFDFWMPLPSMQQPAQRTVVALLKEDGADQTAVLQSAIDQTSPKPANQLDDIDVVELATVHEMTPEMMRKVQIHSELGAYAAANFSGAYDLFQEFWRVAMSAAPQQEQEPVITKNGEGMLLHSGWDSLPDGAKLYAALPQPARREWVALTPQNYVEIFKVARTGEHAVQLAEKILRQNNV